MKCPSCNAELPPTAKFCGACGTTLSNPPQPEQAWNPPPPEQNWAPMPPPEQNWAPPPPQPSYPMGGFSGGAIPPVEKRFKVLRLIAILIKIFAFVAGGLMVIAALVMMVAGAASSSAARSSAIEAIGPQLFGGFVGGVIFLVYGVFMFVFLYGYAEVIYLFLALEENTRVTNEMLRSR